MTINNLFEMARADKYTADGRAAIEDAGYEEGHVSHRKDGDYIKQGGSWVPYKGKGAQKQPNPNGITARLQQQQEAERYETARRDANMRNGTTLARKPLKETFEQMWKEQPSGASNLDLAEVAQKSGLSFEQAKVAAEKDPSIKVSKYMDRYLVSPANSKSKEQKPAAPTESTPEYDAWEKQQLAKQNQRAAEDPMRYGYEEPPMAPAADPEPGKLSDEEEDIYRQIVKEFIKHKGPQTEKIMNEAKNHLMKKRGISPAELARIGKEVFYENDKNENKDAAPLASDTKIRVKK